MPLGAHCHAGGREFDPRRCRHFLRGLGLAQLSMVSENNGKIYRKKLHYQPEQVYASGKSPFTVKVRSVLCYWAVRKLGLSAAELFKRLCVSRPSVSISVKRGENIAKDGQLELE